MGSLSPPPTRGPAVTGRRTTAAVAFAVAKYVTCAAAVALGTMLFWCGASQQSGTAATAGRLGVSRLRPDAGPAAADANYPLWTDYHLSLARRFLTQEVYRELYGVVTPSGFSVDDAVQVAVDMPSGAEVTVGCYAGDVQSYTTFASLFDPVIEAYHHVALADYTPASDLGPATFEVPDIPAKYVLSTRIAGVRSVDGFVLPPAMNRAQRRGVERAVANALLHLERKLKGRYYQYTDMSKPDRDRLVGRHFLFREPDRQQLSAGLGRDWPDNRGMFYNELGSVMVWVNTQDHVTVVSLRRGLHPKQAFATYATMLRNVERQIKLLSKAQFVWDDRLGFMSSAPAWLGTAMRVSVRMRLPKLGASQQLPAVVRALGLHLKPVPTLHNNQTRVDRVFDVSHRRPMAALEAQAVQAAVDGVAVLAKLEEHLEDGDTIDWMKFT